MINIAREICIKCYKIYGEKRLILLQEEMSNIYAET